MSSTRKLPKTRNHGYKMDYSKEPKTECRVRGCRKDKEKESFCLKHYDRVVLGVMKKDEEYLAERLMGRK